MYWLAGIILVIITSIILVILVANSHWLYVTLVLIMYLIHWNIRIIINSLFK